MKKIINILYLFLITILGVNAQEINYNKNFIYTNKGNVIYGKRIEYHTPVFKKNYFNLDSLRYESKDVKFYKSGVDFFGNTQGGGNFARRTIKGKVNYYVLRSTHYNAAPVNNFGGVGFGGVTTSETYYYNTGFSDLKIANYENLSVDLKDNPQSIVYLEKEHKSKNKRTIAYVLGGIATVAGILTAAKKTGETTNSLNPNTGRFERTDVTELRPVNLAIGLAGFGTLIATYLSSRKKKEYLLKAIETYNDN